MYRIKNIIQLVRIFFSRKLQRKKSFFLADRYLITEYNLPGKHVFFGYHDITPFNKNTTRVLVGSVDTQCASSKQYTLEVGYFDLNNKLYSKIDTTTSWCWQQSCRMQWWPTKENWVVFNKTIAKMHKAVVIDIDTHEQVKVFDKAIYSISNNANWGVSLDFPRLQRLRPGYGYSDIPDKTSGQLAPNDSGLWLVNLETGKIDLILTLADIANWESTPDMAEAEHYFNHVMWSPNSQRFLFYHLWKTKTGKRKARALIWDVIKEEFFALRTEGHASHYAWVNNQELIIYSQLEQTGMNFHKFNILSGEVMPIGRELIDQDAHLMVNPVQNQMLVMDYYPDNKFSEQKLFTYDLNKEKIEEVGSFYAPLKFRGEFRCDLHSRWNSTGDKICIDSAHDGKRALYVIEKRAANVN